MTERRRPQSVYDAPIELTATEYAALRAAVGKDWRIEQYSDRYDEAGYSGWYYLYSRNLDFWFVKDPNGGFWCGWSGGTLNRPEFYGDSPAEAFIAARAAKQLGVKL